MENALESQELKKSKPFAERMPNSKEIVALGAALFKAGKAIKESQDKVLSFGTLHKLEKVLPLITPAVTDFDKVVDEVKNASTQDLIAFAGAIADAGGFSRGSKVGAYIEHGVGIVTHAVAVYHLMKDQASEQPSDGSDEAKEVKDAANIPTP